MTREPTMTRSQERAVMAFEVEVETLFVKLTKLRPGKTTEVWLTPNWILACRYHPMSLQVGVYSRDVTLAALSEDAHWTLGQAKRGARASVSFANETPSRACAFQEQP